MYTQNNPIHPPIQQQEQLILKAESQVTLQSLQNLINNLDLKLINFYKLTNGGGSVNPMYVLNTQDINQNKKRLYLKLSNPHTYWENLKTENEVAMISLLQDQIQDFPVPKILDYNILSNKKDTKIIDCEYILMEEVQGILLEQYFDSEKFLSLDSNIQLEQVQNILIQLYKLLSQIKNLKIQKDKICGFNMQYNQTKINLDGPSLGPFTSMKDQFIQFYQWHVDKLLKNEGKYNNQKKLIDFLNKLISNLNNGKIIEDWEKYDQQFQLCHLDMHGGNIFIDPESLKITGIIDWEHSRVSHYISISDEFDLVGKFNIPSIVEEQLKQQRFQDHQLYNLGILDKNFYQNNIKEIEKIRHLNNIMYKCNDIIFFVSFWFNDIQDKEKANDNQQQECYTDLIQYLDENDFWNKYG